MYFGKVELNSAKEIVETEDEIIVPAILERESILQYGNMRSYRSAEELQAPRARFTLDGALIVAYQHTPNAYVTEQDVIRGKVRILSWNPEINAFHGELHFTKSFCDAVLLKQLREGKLGKDISSAYFCREVFEAGEFGGQKFDSRQEGFVFYHVAVGVPEGRCPSPYCGIMDSFSDFVRVSVRPQQLFSRLTTVRVSVKEGIYALVGKLRQGTKETVTSELMFDAEKGWTQEKAEAWAKEHKNSVGVLNTEETEDFVHVRVRDPDLFVDGSFRTIDVDAEKGVTAVVGKLKSDPDGAMVVQKYVFSKEKGWTMENAEAWVKEHKNEAAILLNASGNSVCVNDMSLEDIAAKIAELHKERDDVQGQIDAIYAETRKEEQKLQKEIDALYAKMPRGGDDPKLMELYSRLEDIQAEITGFREKKIEIEVGATAENLVDSKPELKLDAFEVLEKSRRLLGSR